MFVSSGQKLCKKRYQNFLVQSNFPLIVLLFQMHFAEGCSIIFVAVALISSSFVTINGTIKLKPLFQRLKSSVSTPLVLPSVVFATFKEILDPSPIQTSMGWITILRNFLSNQSLFLKLILLPISHKIPQTFIVFLNWLMLYRRSIPDKSSKFPLDLWLVVNETSK